MKRVLLIVLAALALVGLALLLLPGGNARWEPGTQSTFVGIVGTNGVMAGTNALFGFNRVPRENAMWAVIEISQNDGTNWRAWDPLPSPSFSWINYRLTNYAFAATVPLQSTSATTRVVIELTRQPSSWLGQVL